MEVPCDEGLANHIGPESCAGSREAVGEALTGVRAGQPLSGERLHTRSADAFQSAEGNTGGALRECQPGSASSVAPLARTQSGRERLAVHARKPALQPCPSKATTTSSITAAKPGTISSHSQHALPLSEPENGPMGSKPPPLVLLPTPLEPGPIEAKLRRKAARRIGPCQSGTDFHARARLCIAAVVVQPQLEVGHQRSFWGGLEGKPLLIATGLDRVRSSGRQGKWPAD